MIYQWVAILFLFQWCLVCSLGQLHRFSANSLYLTCDMMTATM